MYETKLGRYMHSRVMPTEPNQFYPAQKLKIRTKIINNDSDMTQRSYVEKQYTLLHWDMLKRNRQTTAISNNRISFPNIYGSIKMH